MPNPVITVENLSKAYRIGLKEEIPDTLVGAATSWLKAPLRNFKRLRRLNTFSAPKSEIRNPKSEIDSNGPLTTDHGPRTTANGQPSDIIWALKDVSFEVTEGEVLGIIGRNAAGKSTLLKVLSRITEPTSGRAVLRGRVGSLLEVGTGFHPELTGRENVYMNGTILGMRKREIDRKFDEIVDFSGVEKFLDTPIKRYSSGMNVRLAFAVAAHLEPEILIIDEVLAVGDAEFQKKCLGKMESVAESGRTVLFVSHHIPSVERLCASVLWIDHGTIKDVGTANSICEKYINSEVQARECSHFFHGSPNPDGIRFLSIELLTDNDTPRCSFRADEKIKVRMNYEVQSRISRTIVDLNIFDRFGSYLWSMNDCDAFPELFDSREVGFWSYECIVPANVLAPGMYSVGVSGGTPTNYCNRLSAHIPFEITPVGYWKPSHVHFGIGGGPVTVKMLARRPRLIASDSAQVR